jgi:hypothetical protein
MTETNGTEPSDGEGKEGTFLVTHAEADSAVLKDVDGGQVNTLSENPGVEAGDVLEGTVAPDPPMEVTYSVVGVESRRSLSVEVSEEPPTAQERDLAGEEGEVVRTERAGVGEIHVITVPEGTTEQAVEEVREDEETLARAARLGVNRVEIRSDEGLVSVRYLP